MDAMGEERCVAMLVMPFFFLLGEGLAVVGHGVFKGHGSSRYGITVFQHIFEVKFHPKYRRRLCSRAIRGDRRSSCWAAFGRPLRTSASLSSSTKALLV